MALVKATPQLLVETGPGGGLGYEWEGRRIRVSDGNNLAAELAAIGATQSPPPWAPIAMPSFLGTESGHLIDVATLTASGVISMWESLRLANQAYISRQSIGLDASGVHTLWKYVFEPTSYTNTIIIGACIHGIEKTSALALWSFMREIANSQPGGQLGNLRNNCRIIVLPLQNPWGFDNASRKNYNQVDINRNSSFKWDEFTPSVITDSTYKGPSAWSESEAQAIKAVIESYPDATAYIDLHNTNSSTGPNYYICCPSKDSFPLIVTSKLIDKLSSGAEDSQIMPYSEPNIFNWAAERGMIACNPEWCDGKFGPKYGTVDMTKQVRWYGNLILAYAAIGSSAALLAKYSPKTWVFRWHSGSDQLDLTNTSPASIVPFEKRLPIPCPGILHINGYITVSHSVAGGVVTVCPIVGQGSQGGRYSEYDQEAGMFSNYGRTIDGNDRVSIAFEAAYPVLPSGLYLPQPKIGLFLSATPAGTTKVFRYFMTVRFVPSDTIAEFWSASGRLSEGANAMLRLK